MGSKRSTLRMTAALTVLLACGVLWAVAQRVSKNPAVVPVDREEPWWVARHQAKIAEAQKGGVDLLLVGDSITQNYEKTGPAPDEVFAPAWAKYFAAHRPMNLGFSGDRTEHVLWRLQHGEVDGLTPKDVVLLIGTNNTAVGQTAEQVTDGTIAVVEELHQRIPAAKILVIGILPSEISPSKSETDRAVNLAVMRRYAGAGYVRTLDVSDVFMLGGVVDSRLFYDPRLHPPRGALHPDTVGQARMAERVAMALYGPVDGAPKAGNN